MPRSVRATALAVLALAAVVANWTHHHSQPRTTPLNDGTTVSHCSDSTLTPDSGFPHPRSIQVDGEFYLRVPAALAAGAPSAEPLSVHSRLLGLIISAGSTVHIIARSHEAGEQVEVLEGEVIARKNYPSAYTEPDHLGPGQMSMVNQTIDLMEKETLHPTELQALRKSFREQCK